MLSLHEPVFKGGALQWANLQLRHGSPLHKAPSGPRSWPLRTALRRIRPFFHFSKRIGSMPMPPSRQQTLSPSHSVPSAFETAKPKAPSESALCRQGQIECSPNAS
ncbi:uncharacterized protein PSANT_02215 [Moesziomyces antarcticus]|uniref:Uncharacterized protein n=1 Tax=Pseudozyma antarctica TaxID=84753 RepID=A0A5C3FJZ9_PSEA2|nr:uncharacterized protein PSANT_02215 [Moesziomyces antarcticus]